MTVIRGISTGLSHVTQRAIANELYILTEACLAVRGPRASRMLLQIKVGHEI